MSVLSVKTIPTRNWKNRNIDVVTERDKGRKQSQQKVDERIHYLWFHYLRLALNLEQLNYNVEKRGGRGKLISETKVKVRKSVYKKWDLDRLPEISFNDWYDDEGHRNLFFEGGFKHS